MPARLVVKAGLTDRKEYVLEAGKSYAIGRSRDADIIVKDQRASRRHCTIDSTPDGQWTIADNNSSNGTYVNRQRVKSQPLRDGDVVQVGKATLEFRSEAPAAVPAPRKPTAAEAPTEPWPPKQRSEAPTEPPPAEPAPSQQAAPAAAPAAKTGGPAAPGELDEDLKGLFDFLDRIDAGEKPAAAAKPKPPPEPPAPSEGPAPAKTPEPAPKKDGEDDALFALFDDYSDAEKPAEPPPADQEAQPTEDKPQQGEDQDEEPQDGGLMDFLRKKKQD